MDWRVQYRFQADWTFADGFSDGIRIHHDGMGTKNRPQKSGQSLEHKWKHKIHLDKPHNDLSYTFIFNRWTSLNLFLGGISLHIVKILGGANHVLTVMKFQSCLLQVSLLTVTIRESLFLVTQPRLLVVTSCSITVSVEMIRAAIALRSLNLAGRFSHWQGTFRNLAKSLPSCRLKWMIATSCLAKNKLIQL